MKHLNPDEILEYLKGRLGPETAATFRRHLEECETCRAELAAVESTAAWLESYPDAEVPPGHIEKVTATIAGLQPVAPADSRINGRAGRRSGQWLPRLAAAAAAVAIVLGIQAFFWNPFGGTVNVQGLLTLTPPAMAMPAGQALPDTVLVITIHSDGTVSVPGIDEQLTPEELTERLPGMAEPGTWRTILLLGADPENPVSIRLDRFEQLKEALEITNLRVGSGVTGVAPFFWSFSQPAWNIRRAFPSTGGDSLGVPLFAPTVPFTAGSEALHWQFHTGEGLPGHWVYREEAEGGWIFNIVPGEAWNLSTHWIAPNLATGTPGNILTEYSALTEGNGVTAAITEEGDIILSRGVTDMNRAEQQLRALAERIPDLRLRILVPEGMSERAQILERAARNLGITSVEIVRVKKDS
jgi:hypothetical protein